MLPRSPPGAACEAVLLWQGPTHVRSANRIFRYVEVVILSVRMLTCWQVGAVPKSQRKNSWGAALSSVAGYGEGTKIICATRSCAFKAYSYNSCLECMRGMHRHYLEFNVPDALETA